MPMFVRSQMVDGIDKCASIISSHFSGHLEKCCFQQCASSFSLSFFGRNTTDREKKREKKETRVVRMCVCVCVRRAEITPTTAGKRGLKGRGVGETEYKRADDRPCDVSADEEAFKLDSGQSRARASSSLCVRACVRARERGISNPLLLLPSCVFQEFSVFLPATDTFFISAFRALVFLLFSLVSDGVRPP